MNAPARHAASYYAASSHPHVCVVGGGFSGLNTAIELAERGLSVVLLEASKIGWGASGRNGGQLIRGVGHGLEQFTDIIGQDGVHQLKRLGLEAVEIVRRTTEIYTLSLHDALPIWRTNPVTCKVSPRRPRNFGNWVIATKPACCRPMKCTAWSVPAVMSAA